MTVEQPLAYYGTLSAAMGACLYLFVSVARDLEAVKRRLERRIAKTEEETAIIGAQSAAIGARLTEVETTVGGLAAARRANAMAAGVDASQRTQVLRLARRGDRPEQIAAELRVPRNEVDLLIKVQRAIRTGIPAAG